MVPITIDEQFKKLILLDNEHDLILLKSVKQKQMHQCHSQCKTISTLKLANTNLLLLYLLNNMQLNIQSQKGELKKNSNKCDF